MHIAAETKLAIAMFKHVAGTISLTSVEGFWLSSEPVFLNLFDTGAWLANILNYVRVILGTGWETLL